MHDNTVSAAYEAHNPLKRGYMARIVEYQRIGAPFVGHLHSSGYMVRRTDRFCPYKWYRVTYVYGLGGHEQIRNMSSRDLAALQADRMYRILAIVEIEPPKNAWIPEVSKSWLRAYAVEVKKLQRGGGGKPLLQETVVSDGETTTYTTYWR